MNDATLQTLAPLLAFLRSYEVLDEVRPAGFCLRGRDFLHFHDQVDGLWADVRLTRGQVRVPVATEAEQAELMGKIADALDAVADRGRRDLGRSRRRRDRGA